MASKYAASSKSSSSSTLAMSPTSPIPSSVEAMPQQEQQQRKRKGKGKAVDGETNGTSVASTTAGEGQDKQPARGPAGRRTRRGRSGSLQERGAAVLRALARAEEEQSDASAARPGASSGQASDDDEDSGYEGETNNGQPNVMPVPQSNGHAPMSASMQASPSQPTLSDEQKQTGRDARSGIRQRQEQRAVERVTKTSTSKRKKAKRGKATAEGKKSKSWEIPRKIFHSSIGFMVLYLYLSRHDLDRIVRGLSTFLGIVVTADVIRLNVPSFEWLYEKVLGFLMRETEKDRVNGVVWYLIGVLFSLRCMPEDIACVSICILSWADTAASTFGRLFGKYTPPLPSPPFASRKSLAGTLAATAVSALTAALFWATPIAESARRSVLATEGRGGMPVPLLCLGSGLVGGIAEALELGGVDDNLSLPILSALGIRGLTAAWRYFFG